MKIKSIIILYFACIFLSCQSEKSTSTFYIVNLDVPDNGMVLILGRQDSDLSTGQKIIYVLGEPHHRYDFYGGEHVIGYVTGQLSPHEYNDMRVVWVSNMENSREVFFLLVRKEIAKKSIIRFEKSSFISHDEGSTNGHVFSSYKPTANGWVHDE